MQSRYMRNISFHNFYAKSREIISTFLFQFYSIIIERSQHTKDTARIAR